MDYVKTLKDIAIELVEDKEHLEVRQMPSLDENVVVLHVYSAKNDIAKLIGRKGVMANSIRQLMSVAGRLSDKKLDIKFHYHMLRHTDAIELMMVGVNPIIVRDLLEHSTVNTTWNVYNILVEKLREKH